MVKFSQDTRQLLTVENVKYIMMKHGDSLLAFVLVEESQPNILYVFNPVKIIDITNPITGGVQYLMSEWISQRISMDEGFEIKAEDVLVMADVEKGMLKTYMAFSSRLDEFRVRLQNGEMDNLQVDYKEGPLPSDDGPGEGDIFSLDESMDEDAILDQLSRLFHPSKKTLH